MLVTLNGSPARAARLTRFTTGLANTKGSGVGQCLRLLDDDRDFNRDIPGQGTVDVDRSLPLRNATQTVSGSWGEDIAHLIEVLCQDSDPSLSAFKTEPSPRPVRRTASSRPSSGWTVLTWPGFPAIAILGGKPSHAMRTCCLDPVQAISPGNRRTADAPAVCQHECWSTGWGDPPQGRRPVQSVP